MPVFSWDSTKPGDTDLISVYPALDRPDKSTLAAVLGTLTPLGAPTCGWRVVQVGNAIWMTQNARYTGSGWVVDDTGTAASCIIFDPVDNFITFGWQAAGTSPFTTWQVMAVVSAAAGAANYLQLIAQATGAAPQLTAQGADPNIGINLVTKGTGAVSVNGQALAQAQVAANGYVRLGPITLQWGSVGVILNTANSWVTATVTLPVAYSQAVYAVSVALMSGVATTQNVVWENATTTSFTVSVYASSTGTYAVSWIAVGAS
jgi:hypothetical protein